MHQFLQLTVIGLVVGSVYAIAATGVVVTYTTSGIFNFAHGAVAAVAAFGYWDLAVRHHWPHALALLVVVLVLAPIAGALVERVVMRPLADARLEAQLTATVGLLLLLLGLANAVWDPAQPHTIPFLFGGVHVTVAGIVVTGSELLTLGVAALVAVALRVLFTRTRPGIAMRAVVDSRDLAGLTGADPARYGQLGWMLGFALAALAGILVAPTLGPELTVTNVTLLVINGYAAAVVGRLRNVPMTFVGGLLLGLVENYARGYVPSDSVVAPYTPAVSMVFLVLALLVLPQDRLRSSRAEASRFKPPRVPSLRLSLGAAVALVAAAVGAGSALSDNNLLTASHGMAYAIIGLSVLLVTGYGAAVMLCPLTFAGLGAFAVIHIGGGGSWWGVLAGTALAAAAGALVALPALRLRGLYLALVTLAFGYALDAVFFSRSWTFLSSTLVTADRVTIPGVPISADLVRGDQNLFIVEAVVFALLGFGLVALRRSRFGRRLVALGDSPAAYATVGLRPTVNRLAVFTASAAIAGFGGAVYVEQQGNVSGGDFALLGSLSLLLIVVVWGVRTVSGVLVAGVLLAIGQILPAHLPGAFRDVVDLAIGLSAVGIARNPNGVLGSWAPWSRRGDGDDDAARQVLSGVPAQRVAAAEVPHVAR